MKDKAKIKYPTYSFKLNEKTYKLLKEKRDKRGKSWNIFFYNLIKEKKNI
jgi:hypothetical protein